MKETKKAEKIKNDNAQNYELAHTHSSNPFEALTIIIY
jgi:hypothetical protein